MNFSHKVELENEDVEVARVGCTVTYIILDRTPNSADLAHYRECYISHHLLKYIHTVLYIIFCLLIKKKPFSFTNKMSSHHHSILPIRDPMEASQDNIQDVRLTCVPFMANPPPKGNCEAQTQSAPLPVILDELVECSFQLALLYFFLIKHL